MMVTMTATEATADSAFVGERKSKTANESREGNATIQDNANCRKLSVVNLKRNLLKGIVKLANYGDLTELNVSENNIEELDVSALANLKYLNCAHNVLTRLKVNGRVLVELVASNNKLKSITTDPAPQLMESLDLSCNELRMLPEWISRCSSLRTLDASRNRLTVLPHDLFDNDDDDDERECGLISARLCFNRLTALPRVTRRVPIRRLHLHNNNLTTLPAQFFRASADLQILNVSKNCLKELPPILSEHEKLEKLYVTSNALTDLTSLLNCHRLRILHVAYNAIDFLPEECVSAWPRIEELILSANGLRRLPRNVNEWRNLKILRIHSNLLESCPNFTYIPNLTILDLSNNRLNRIDLHELITERLQFLDISRNESLVEPKHFQYYRSRRRIDLVDVTGHGRNSLPSSYSARTLPPPSATRFCEQQQQPTNSTWTLGFSESVCGTGRWYVSQLRDNHFRQSEVLIGVFAIDDLNTHFNSRRRRQLLCKSLTNDVPQILQSAQQTSFSTIEDGDESDEEKDENEEEDRDDEEEDDDNANSQNSSATVTTTSNTDYIKFTLLSLHQKFHEKESKIGSDDDIKNSLECRICSITLCHICRSRRHRYNRRLGRLVRQRWATERKVTSEDKRRHVLRIASMGEATTAILRRDTGSLIVSSSTGDRTFSTSSSTAPAPASVRPAAGNSAHDPYVIEIDLCPRDRFLLLANNNLWKVISTEEAVAEVESLDDPTLAAKRLQDLAQSYGCEDTLSIMVLRLDRGEQRIPRSYPRLHDEWEYEYEHASRKDEDNVYEQQMHDNRSQSFVHFSAADVPQRWTTHADEPASTTTLQMSEKDFRCWEYMLEQNTKMLFDKELDTLSRNFTKRRLIPSRPELWSLPSTMLRPSSAATVTAMEATTTTPLTSNGEKIISHLPDCVQNTPYLFKNLVGCGGGSNDSDSVMVVGDSAPLKICNRSWRSVNGSSKPRPTHYRRLNGGPNAAYFGSLQRLIPYHVEYNYSEMVEKRDYALDSLEEDCNGSGCGRMRKYWDVTTTEL